MASLAAMVQESGADGACGVDEAHAENSVNSAESEATATVPTAESILALKQEGNDAFVAGKTVYHLHFPNR